jgi:hypothetical protein
VPDGGWSSITIGIATNNHPAEDHVLGGVTVLWVRVSRPRAGVT